MTTKTLDIAKWNTDRLEAEAQIRALKLLVRVDDKPVMEWRKNAQHNWSLEDTGRKYRGATDNQAWEISVLKARLTNLYALRAHLRGRQHQRFEATVDHFGKHVKPFTAERDAARAKELLKHYTVSKAA